MKYTVEDNLRNFPFWCGAKETADALTPSEIDTIERMMEDCEPEDGWTDTAINDFFWFERDTIAEWLGYRDADAMSYGDKDSWQEHYAAVLTSEFPEDDPDLIEEFIIDELEDNATDGEVIKDYENWKKEQEEEEE